MPGIAFNRAGVRAVRDTVVRDDGGAWRRSCSGIGVRTRGVVANRRYRSLRSVLAQGVEDLLMEDLGSRLFRGPCR